ncbi:hypothetical protein CL654_03190 [bacterium]|nr:hypothetical protein [bacterium]|tara:strand:+ start:26089 stop:26355 length:267 start_codon:yes stop_codon:yes gene_type:complete
MENNNELFPNLKKEGTTHEVHHPHALMWVTLLVIVTAVIAGGWFVLLQNKDRNAPTEPIACTADAMQCPDGSWVGRTGPNCEFVCPSP